MEIGQKAKPRTRRIAEALGRECPAAVEALSRQGHLTVQDRWKLGCGEPYWLAFRETPGVAFPEDAFTATV